MPRCPDCGEYFATGPDVQGHRQEKHPKSNPYGYIKETWEQIQEWADAVKEAEELAEAERKAEAEAKEQAEAALANL